MALADGLLASSATHIKYTGFKSTINWLNKSVFFVSFPYRDKVTFQSTGVEGNC